MLILPNVNTQFEHGTDKSDEIMSFLKDHQDTFSHDLIGDLSHIHHRADSLSGIKINDVSHRGENNYLLDFSYEWFAHVGCGHTAHEDTEHHRVTFKVADTGEIKFNVMNLDARSTFEEF